MEIVVIDKGEGVVIGGYKMWWKIDCLMVVGWRGVVYVLVLYLFNVIVSVCKVFRKWWF